MGLQGERAPKGSVRAQDRGSTIPGAVVARSLASTRATAKKGVLPFIDHLML